eukprot:5058133-Pleurochrysis_carterae.AAC.2
MRGAAESSCGAPDGPRMARTVPGSTVPDMSSMRWRGDFFFSPFFLTITVYLQFLKRKVAGCTFFLKELRTTVWPSASMPG